MKMIKRFLFLIICCCLFSAAYSQRCAVLEFKAGVGLSQADVDGISSIFITYFQPDGYTMVERTQIDKTIEEQGFQRSSLTDNQMVRIGQILNVSKIVVGTVNIVLGEYNIDVRVLNVETGTVAATEGVSITSGSYRNSMQKLAQNLASKIAIDNGPIVQAQQIVVQQPDNSSQNKSEPIILYGYLKVFPNDLGSFSEMPYSTIKRLNDSHQYGYDTWRIPTKEELSLLRANNIVVDPKDYMSSDGYSSGIVRLVTDKEKWINPEVNGYKYVDLGLSVKWAIYNVGATKPEEYGDYYAWGETETQTFYGSSSYKWCNGFITTITKYNSYDKKITLDPGDDVAHVKWGGTWRMPTKAEQDELCNNCTWKWTTLNGVNGYLVTSNKSGYTDRSIFLPAAGFRRDARLSPVGDSGYYWSSSLNTDDPSRAWSITFSSGSVSTGSNSLRPCGFSVRPVCP